jgi:hypothetical protein
MGKSFLKQAEQNVINQAKAWADAMEFLNALQNFGNRACHDYIGKEKFFAGLTLMRQAMYQEQSEAIRNCFSLVGVGGEEAAKYSRDRFKEVFSDKYQIMQFLDKWGHCPNSYKTADREAFEAECREVASEI